VSLLPNIFSDPALRARQDQLDAQWNSLWASYQQCDNTPSAAFPEFSTDLRLWREFYASGSDWSSDSKHETDIWQGKAQEWAGKLAGWCAMGADSGIPTVKDAPPDSPGVLDRVLDPFKKTEADIFSFFKGTGIAIFVLILIVIFALVFVLTKGKANAFGVKLGDG
jgi:hypothetical protein